MIFRSAFGAAMFVVQALDAIDRPPRPSTGAPRGQKRDLFIPNDHGPVYDSTRESKRARRRRLAREATP